MEDNSKKDLTNCKKECTIWLKLVALAKEKKHGVFFSKIFVHDGKIREIRHRDFEGSIRE